MFLTRLALNRPVSLLLFLFTISVFGINAIFGFKMAYQPQIDMPTYIVLTIYPGAEPEIIDSTVSKEVEKIGATISGFTESTVMSEEGVSTVIFMFDYDIEKNQTYLDLKTAVDQLTLPDDAQSPILLELSFDSAAMMTLSVTGNQGEDVLGFAEDTLTPQIDTLLGVADIDIYGGQENYIRIIADPTLLNQYGISMSTLANAISAYDFEMPIGSVVQGTQDMSVSSGSSLDSLADLQEVAVTTGSGDVIPLKEIAQVMIGAKSASSLSRYDGRDNITLEIMNSQDANIPDVAKQIYTVIDRVSAENPNFSIEITNDSSELIITTLMSVVDTVIMAVVLCMLVLYVFLGNIRASLIVGSSIPISLMITLICMSVFGFELNMVTANALVIAIGLMVDNAIVVLESIFKVKAEIETTKANQGMSKLEEFKKVAYEGCSVVGASVVASTITTIVVYLPLTTLGGVSGQMFVHLSYTIVFAMLASLFAATVLVPMFYFLLKPEEKRSAVTIFMEALEKIYVKAVAKVIRQRVLVVMLAWILLFGSFALAAQIPLELIPESDTGNLLFAIDFRPNSTLEEMNEIISPIEEMLVNDDRISSYQLNISGNSASITAFAASGKAKPLVEEYMYATLDMPNMSVSVSGSGDEMMESMMGDMTLITTTLHGYDYDQLQEAALDLEEKLYATEGVSKVTSSLGAWGSAKADIKIDPKKAMDYGTSPLAVAQTLRQAVTGYEVGEMDIGTEEYDVFIEFPAGYAEDLNTLMSLDIDTPYGKVPVSQMAELSFTNNLDSIKKINGYYCIDLTVTPVEGANAQVTVAISQLAISETKDGVFVGNGPGIDYITDEVISMVSANATAVFLVFMVMAMQFESLRFSVMVMTSVMFSFIGSFGLLYISGQPLTIVSMMGVLMLMGIVVNNGILFVDTANQNRKLYPTLEEALVKSGQTRMRPIIMTTLTTVLSMVPLAFGIGEGTEMMQSMGIVIIGGLLASTILVLFLMPTFYIIISKKDKTPPPQDPPPMDESTKEDSVPVTV